MTKRRENKPCAANDGSDTKVSGQFRKQVVPVWIPFFDQTDLPGTIPAFELFFPLDRPLDFLVNFIIHQAMHAIFRGKLASEAFTVLRNPAQQVIRHPDIERAAQSACKNVDILLLIEVQRGAFVEILPG